MGNEDMTARAGQAESAFERVRAQLKAQLHQMQSALGDVRYFKDVE